MPEADTGDGLGPDESGVAGRRIVGNEGATVDAGWVDLGQQVGKVSWLRLPRPRKEVNLTGVDRVRGGETPSFWTFWGQYGCFRS